MNLWPFPGSERKEHPKVLILVLSALRDPWGHMLRVQRETWDSVDHPQTKTLYYCGKGGCAPGHELNPAWVSLSNEGDIFYSPMFGEELEEVCPRTREAFAYALKLEWDFMARVHSSGYVHKKNLVDFIESGVVPSKNLFCGLLTEGVKPFLWGGGNYILSRDVVERFVEASARWNLDIMEDTSLTELAIELGVPLNRSGRMCSLNKINEEYSVMSYGIDTVENFAFNERDWPQIKRVHPHWVFRCKQDLRRHEDIEIMKKLQTHYL